MSDIQDSQTDPLLSLVVDVAEQAERSRQLLADILSGLIAINKDDMHVSLLDGAFNLIQQDTVLVLLCGWLAQSMLNLSLKDSNKSGGLTYSEVCRQLPTVSPSSIGVYLKRLVVARFITNVGGVYSVPLSNLVRIKEHLYQKNKSYSDKLTT